MKHLFLLLVCCFASHVFAYTYYNPTAYGLHNPGEQALFVSIHTAEKQPEAGKSFVFDALTKELLYTSPRFFNMNSVELCANSDYLFCEDSDSDKKYYSQKIVVFYKGLPHDSLEWKSSMKDFYNSTYAFTEDWKEAAEGIYFKFNDGKVIRYSYNERSFDTVPNPDDRKWTFDYRSESALVTDIFSAELLFVGEETPLAEQLLKDLVIPETVSVRLKLTIDTSGIIEQHVHITSVDLTREEEEKWRKLIAEQLKTYQFTEPLYLLRTGFWHYELQFFGIKN